MENFFTALGLLGTGMLAIFIAVGVIFVFVLIMNNIDKKNNEKNLKK